MPTVPVNPSAPFLIDLQANILKFHGRQNAMHLFLTFNADDVAATKTAIKQIAEQDITCAQKQWSDAKKHKEDPGFDGGPVITFSLSASGYHKLGLTAMIPRVQIIDHQDGVSKIDPAFEAGMKNRASKLGDDTGMWDEGFTQNIDAVIIVADNDIKILDAKVSDILTILSPFAKVEVSQRGTILKNSNGIGIEHFGYADGVSQPIYLDEEIASQGPREQWDDTGNLDNVLVADPGSEEAESFGSFFVFRKLEQNVLGFKTQEKLLPSVLDRHGNVDDDLPGAMIVGRFEDGSETVNDSNARGITQESQLFNDFDYRDDAPATKCPFHAHIRITNPRSDVTNAFAHTVRLTRRGIPYNDINRNVGDLENDQPETGVGLLFQCYQKSLTNQFEFIQKAWANDGDIGGHMVGQDGIIGQGANPFVKHLPAQWGILDSANAFSFSKFVKMLGGEYFFTPSISFLKRL